MTRRGWCPTVHAPMPSGDGLLVRVKPPASRLSATAARALADAAAEFGNGAIELTQRGNVQVRGLRPTTAPDFAAAIIAAGLASPDPAAERRRTVLLAPLAGAEATAVALALEAALAEATGLEGLSDKFGFVVDDGELPLAGVRADVRLSRTDCWRVQDGGRTVVCSAGEAPGVALDLAKLVAAASRPDSASPAATMQGATFAFLPFGSTVAGTLRALAGLAEREGDGTLRLTPWRGFLLPGAIDPESVATLGLIADPEDPRRGILACPGRPACASAHADTRADAARLARLRPGLRAHVSGCAKGCAHPAAAPLTLVAQPGGYDLVRDGRAADPPTRQGMSLDDVLLEYL